MASEELAGKAKQAFVDDEFELAVDLFTQAIRLNPANGDLFVDRAQAYIKLNYFTDAVGDANRAIELDRSMSKAYLRKGTACLKLEEYHTAKAALKIGASLTQNDLRFMSLIAECDTCIEVLLDSHMGWILDNFSEENMILNESMRPKDQPSSTPVVVETLAKFEKRCNLSDHSDTALKPKYRHEYYQKPDEVIVTIFAKGVPARNVVVQFGEQILSVTVTSPGEDAYHFQPRLFSKIRPNKCGYQVLPTKIEVGLVKAEAIHWTSLNCNSNVVTAPKQKVNVPSVGTSRPVFPTSKARAKDWDKLEAEVKKEEQEEKLDGGAGFNKFFHKLYRAADEDARRAMAKSFVESNGTVLSMDWKEVGSKKVESSPPVGMELRKWRS